VSTYPLLPLAAHCSIRCVLASHTHRIPRLQYCTEEHRAALASELPGGAPVASNRERAASGAPYLHEGAVSPKHALDLRAYIGQHIELSLGRDVLAASASAAQKRRIWGRGCFTGDTDILLALVHDGYLARVCLDASFAWPKRIEQVKAVVRVHESGGGYEGAERNGVISRAWPRPCCGFSYSIERAWLNWREVRAGGPD
jgi:hypothetical protein